MKISFPVVYKNTHNNDKTGVWGEEIIANTCCKLLKGHDAKVYSISEFKEEQHDVAVYMCYETIHPFLVRKYAKKNILWIDGFNYDRTKNILPLNILYNNIKPFYDLIITSSRKLARDMNIPFIIPPVDFDIYKKVEAEKKHDVIYIGNIIKPFSTNFKYLNPIGNFDYKIFGGDFGKISHEKWLEEICSTKVNLHYGFEEGIEWDMVTGGPLFIAACRQFQLSDKIPFYMETFGDSFGFTDGGTDEVDKISYYLNNDVERREKAEKAYEIVRSLKYDTLSEIIEGGF